MALTIPPGAVAVSIAPGTVPAQPTPSVPLAPAPTAALTPAPAPALASLSPLPQLSPPALPGACYPALGQFDPAAGPATVYRGAYSGYYYVWMPATTAPSNRVALCQPNPFDATNEVVSLVETLPTLAAIASKYADAMCVSCLAPPPPLPPAPRPTPPPAQLPPPPPTTSPLPVPPPVPLGQCVMIVPCPAPGTSPAATPGAVPLAPAPGPALPTPRPASVSAPPLPPLPEACAGWAFPLSFPKIGSEDWCTAQADVLAALKAMGAAVMDFAINGLDNVEKAVWPWANADVSGVCGQPWAASGFFSNPVTGIAEWLSGFFDCVWTGIKWALGQVAYQLTHGLKALLCMLRAGQARPGSLDYLTYVELWALRYLWKYVKTLRLSSPDYLGLQTIGMDVEDFFDRMLDHILKSLQTMELPRFPEAMEAYLTGTISDVQYRCWMTLNDVDPDVWSPVLQSRREQLTTDEKMDLIRRASLTFPGGAAVDPWLTPDDKAREDQWRAQSIAALRSRGWINVDEAQNRYELYDEIPTIADHLHWLARNVDDAKYVAKYHLLDGFTDAPTVSSIVAASTPGYVPIPMDRDFWREFGPELRVQGMRKIDAARHYAAHWLHGSPGQLREFVYRLRPDRPFGEREKQVKQLLVELNWPPEAIDRGMTFEDDDFRRVLQEQDYAPIDVAWFLGTLYHVPALSYIRDMFRYGVIGKEELKGYHQDLGYTATDSERFVGVDVSVKARLRAAESFGWTPAALSRAYGLGLIEKDFYSDTLKSQGYNADEIASAQDRAGKLAQERVLTRSLGRVITRVITQISSSFGAGVLDRTAAADALHNLGVTELQSKSILDMETLKARTKLVNELVRTVRSAFVKGKVNEDQAREILGSANVAIDYQDALLSTWKAELLRGDRQATLADIKRWVKEGLMTPEEAQLRLANLGIPQADQQLILAELQQAIERVQGLQAAKTQRAVDAQNKALEQAAKQAQTAAAAAIERLKQEAPPGTLARWLRDGIIGAATATDRLRQYGWDQQAIDDWIAEQTQHAKNPLLP